MSRLLKITDLGSGIMVQGTDNVLYPDNATLTYPYNSIIVVTDESNIATFRSASNNDVLFSGLIGKIEIGGEIVTKENINVKFDEIANQEIGGGDVTGLFANASYDSQTKRINFYDKDENIVSYIDATDFIKDGMVSNVAISEGNLVITFNTDSGKEPITIPLTDIFNPNEYYTKTEVDEKLTICEYGDWVETSNAFVSGHWHAIIFVSQSPTLAFYFRINDESIPRTSIGVKAVNNIITYTDINGNVIEKPSYISSDSYFDSTTNKFYVYLTDGFIDYVANTSKYSLKLAESKSCEDIKDYAIGLNSEVDTKANIEDVYNKQTADSTFATQVVVNEEIAARIEAIRDVNTALGTKADKSDTYTKTEVDTALSAKVDQSDFDVKEEVVSTALNVINTSLNNKADKATTYTKTETDTAIQTAVGQIDLSDYVSIQQYNQKELAVAQALTDLNENKADKTDIPNLDNYYTKTQTDAAIQTAVGQIDLSDYQTKEDADTKEEVISTALNNLAANKVNNLGGVANIVKISAADYEALATKDNNTLYIITTN